MSQDEDLTKEKTETEQNDDSKQGKFSEVEADDQDNNTYERGGPNFDQVNNEEHDDNKLEKTIDKEDLIKR